MTKSKSFLALHAGMVIFLIGACTLYAADNSQLGITSTRNNVALSSDVPETWTTTKQVKWKCGLGTQTNGSPVVAGGRIFVGTNNGGGYLARYPSEVDLGVLLCIDEANGSLLWQYFCEKLPTGRVHDWPEAGICSTPLVEGDRLWFVSSRGEVVCLDAEGFLDAENDGPYVNETFSGDLDADVVWRLDMMSELGVQQHNMANCSVTALGDILLVCTSNGVDRTHQQVAVPGAPSFLGLDKHTGRVIWKDHSPGANIVHGQWSSPAVAVTGDIQQAIFAGGDGWLYSFDPKGNGQGKSKLLWKFDCNPKTSRWVDRDKGERNNIIATPVVHGQCVFVATGREPERAFGRGRLWCIDATKSFNGLDVSEELGFDPDGRSLSHRRTQAVDRSIGETVRANPMTAARWCYMGIDRDESGVIEPVERMHRSTSSVAIKDHLLFAVDIAGIVHCLDAESGRPFWTYDAFPSIWASPLIVGNRVIVADTKGVISIFMLSADPRVAMREEDGEHLPLVRWRLDGEIRATPTVSQRILYVATQRILYALDLSNESRQQETSPPPDSVAIPVSQSR